MGAAHRAELAVCQRRDAMSQFEQAYRLQDDAVICPGCGELRHIEDDGLFWWCGVCAWKWPKAEPAPAAPKPKRPGLFKQMPR